MKSAHNSVSSHELCTDFCFDIPGLDQLRTRWFGLLYGFRTMASHGLCTNLSQASVEPSDGVPDFVRPSRPLSFIYTNILDDKVFINNHKKTFRFILTTKSKIYSVSINPKIEVCELTLDFPGLESQEPNEFTDSNGLLLCGMGNGSAMVWNPWLRQTKWIKPEVNQPNLRFSGIGYDHNDNRYKTISSFQTMSYPFKTIWKIHDFSSCHKLKRVCSTLKRARITYAISCVSLDGPLYSSAYQNTNSFFIHMFDFSTEVCYKFCDLPCGRNSRQDALVLSVFRGDRFSLLKQCHLTKKIEVWVTKNKIHKFRSQDVEWTKVMDASVPNLPVLVETWPFSQPSYFIEDKRLVVCSCDETGRAWIYVVEDNKLISKVHIDLVVGSWPLHRTFFPSLVSVPRGQRRRGRKITDLISLCSTSCFRLEES